MNLTSLIMKGLTSRAKAFEKATTDPIKAQERVLLKYLSRNMRTEYASKYNFSAIKSIEDFRARLPLSDYAAIKPYIDRMKKGASGVLTADKVNFFGITSGSTGEPKFIPVTKYSQARKSDLMNIWAYYLTKDHPKIFDGRILGIISPEIKNHTDAGIPYGPEDGHAYNNLPEVIKRLYVLPYELFYIDSYDARYYCILRIAIEHNITTIATLNPSTLTLLCQKIPALQNGIIDDIERGTLDEGLEIAPDIRRAIEGSLKPNPRRASELKALLNKQGKLLPKDFWPHLDLIECWKGGTVKGYLSRLPDYFGNVAVRDFGCLSTEARSSVPMSDSGAGGALAVQTNFYEFIPREDLDKAQKRVLLCDELETGREYLLIVTTAGGLYRYNIDDIVCVKGFFNKTPIIEFIQKGHNVVSITGEKVYESHIEEAVTGSVAKHKTAIRSFSASAVTGEIPRYVFLIEFEGTPSQGEKRALLVSIEKTLRFQNSEYDDLRKQQLIAFPSLRVISPGEFERYRMTRVRDGAHDTQFKMPRLVLSGGFLENFVMTEEIFALPGEE
ncbi:MAG: GH3 auxin-responsive promoter family protein [Candidatus Omnitrophica bacterium]|nr:GH3 auxin-responsive promoter family protein [Candidatus Omnitrophota bacterium]